MRFGMGRKPVATEQTSMQRGGAVRAHKLDAERHAEFAAKYDIRGVPTLLLFRDGRLISRRSGFSTATALRGWIGANAGDEAWGRSDYART